MLGLADQLGPLRRPGAEQDFPAFAAAGGIVAPREARCRGLSASKQDARFRPWLGLGGEGHDRIRRRRGGGSDRGPAPSPVIGAADEDTSQQRDGQKRGASKAR
jgi:hypothetical protein